MNFSYYPGCSSHAGSRAYEESIHAIAPLLGIELKEIDDWNCCGATAYMAVNETLAFSLTARNLMQAKKGGNDPVVTPCNACYTNLRKTQHYMKEYPTLRGQVNQALAEGGLKYDADDLESKHVLEVVVKDIGLEKVKTLVKQPLSELKIAPYYGCQIVRPMGIEADYNNPMMLDHLLGAIGAQVVPFQLKTYCCGGSLIGTNEEVALRLCRNLLECVQANGANCIAVVCPICQLNLDGYQKRINATYGTNFNVPVLYFSQLMGMAFGVDRKKLGLTRGIAPLGPVVERYSEVRA